LAAKANQWIQDSLAIIGKKTDALVPGEERAAGYQNSGGYFRICKDREIGVMI